MIMEKSQNSVTERQQKYIVRFKLCIDLKQYFLVFSTSFCVPVCVYGYIETVKNKQIIYVKVFKVMLAKKVNIYFNVNHYYDDD